jgi:CcmD family protein
MMRRMVLVILVGVAVAVGVGEVSAQEPGAAAQVEAVQPAPAAASGPTQEGFRAIQAQQAADRTMRGYWHLFIAFALSWVVLFGYVVSLGSRFGKLERELERLG